MRRARRMMNFMWIGFCPFCPSSIGFFMTTRGICTHPKIRKREKAKVKPEIKFLFASRESFFAKNFYIFIDLIWYHTVTFTSVLSEVSGWTIINWYFIMHTNLTCETEGRRPESEKNDLFLHVLFHQFFLYFSRTIGRGANSNWIRCNVTMWFISKPIIIITFNVVVVVVGAWQSYTRNLVQRGQSEADLLVSSFYARILRCCRNVIIICHQKSDTHHSWQSW